MSTSDLYGKIPDNFMSYEALINLTLDRVYVPRSVKTYYRLAEYFSSYTIVGTAFRKMSQFPISKIVVQSDDDSIEKKGDRIVSKIKLKEKLVKASINWWTYGISYLFPMFPVKKEIICRCCGRKYPLKDLHEAGLPTYTFNGDDFYYKCTNKKCDNYNRDMIMNVIEKYVENAEDLNIAVWSPNRLTCVHNTVTDQKEYYYTLDAEMYMYIQERNHFIISTMPQIYIKAAKKDCKVRVNSDTLFVMEFPTLTIAGLPLPPIVNVLQDLYQRMKYMSANRAIAEDSLIPLRMLFPVNKGENNGKAPVQTVVYQDWKDFLNTQIGLWKKDRNHIIVAPVEIGTKYAFGDGKMLVMTEHLRANTEDILAGIGIPQEFIYGGATWSRQNVSSIVLENMIQSIASMQQEVLDYVAEVINKSTIGQSNIDISISTPRLVEQMTELAYLKDGAEKGEISSSTFWGRFGIDDKRERRMITKEQREKFEIKKQQAVDDATIQSEQGKTTLNFQKEQRRIERIESVKDSLTQLAIQRDSMELNNEFQKKMIEFQAKMNNKATEDQAVIQHRLLPLQLEQMKAQLELNNKENLDSQEKMMNLNTKMQEKMMEVQNKFRLKTLPVELFTMKAQGEVNLNLQRKSSYLAIDQAKAQVMAENEANALGEQLQQQQEEEQNNQMMEQIYQTLDPNTKKQIDALSDDKKTEALSELIEKQQLNDFIESLTEHEKELVKNIKEETSRNSFVKGLMLKKQEAEQMSQVVQQDPKLLAITLQRNNEIEDEENEINAISYIYHKVDMAEKELLKNSLIQESASKFAKIKARADEMFVYEQTIKLMNSEGDSIIDLWEELSRNHPDMVGEVYNSLTNQMYYKDMATSYAVKLLKMQGSKEYSDLITELNTYAPDEFRKIILSEIETMSKVPEDYLNGTSKCSKLVEDNMVRDIALSLKTLTDQDRLINLNSLKESDLNLYSKVIAFMVDQNNPFNPYNEE